MADLNNLIVDQFYRTTVAKTLDAVGEPNTILVTDASGFPDIAAPKYFYLTLVTGNVAEVVKVINITGNTITTEASISFQFPAGSRAEHWFTAQAFQDVSDYLLSLTGVYPGADGLTIVPETGGPIAVGTINGTHIDPAAVNADKIQKTHMALASVGEDQLTADAVTNLKVNSSGIDAVKIKSLGETVPGDGTGTKLPLNTIPLINFAQIEYTVGSNPSGGEDGDIVIEWEAV